MKIEGKTIWVTGASSGIGRAIAIELAKSGGRLILSARSREGLQSTQKVCLQYTEMAEVVVMDVASESSIMEAWKQVQETVDVVDILINNSGISQRATAASTTMAVARQIMEVNYFGAIQLSKLVLPGMLRQRSGYIVVTGSLSGKFGWKQRSSYAASKFALQGYYESLRAETADQQVQVMMVIPGRIKTDISLHSVTADGTQNQKMDKAQEGGIPADVCARKVVKGIIADKKEIIISGFERLMITIRFLAPWLYYRIAAKRDPNI
ncbi:MAG: hypothetical protein ABR95_03090 [Sphingobacteriales bacterium BACL12 MAG-120813-bin55]|nr:MAG: hypothetical protein ABR94_09395 [Sphingobacteriales bacterium BACL12 MAG-120802-bin5]KRP12631.1 MAG: hypothetical protein ABR95_03090 [Sphingobacteriales bacterium BACL12 MAG-120813-bin55]